MNSARAEDNPYPGLRPFEQRDARVFFGRDEQVDDLLGRLDHTRFIAVVGTSASGKSSLVRAGLLPALYGGHLGAAGSRWRVAVMRPGATAVASLAAALDASGILGTDTDETVRRALARGVLESGDLGLVEIVREARLAAEQNLLIVVDQFEELFRFRHDRDDAPAFVKLLLAAANDPTSRIYVLLTMRSDFLGESAQFPDLPETIGKGIFLVPRLTRDQLREAIDGPAAIAGTEVEPVLITQLLNDLGDSPDQLPVLAHALMRAWDLRQANGGNVASLGLSEFAATGGLASALSIHGDAVYEALQPEDRAAAEKIFRALTDRSTDQRGIRRPTSLAELCAITDAPRASTVRVVEAFRAPGVSFLTPPPNVALEDGTVVDISHESLMRVWTRLSGWVDDEARSARTYRRLADAAELHERGAGALAVDPALSVFLAWRRDDAPTEAWAERYTPGFERAMRYLDASDEKRTRDQRAAGAARRRGAIAGSTIAIALVLVFLSLAALAALQRERGSTLVEESRNLAHLAQAAVDRHDAVTGMLIALAALPTSIEHPDRPFTRAAYDALQRAYLTRRERLDLAGHSRVIYRVAYSRDGRFVATASADGTARIWNAATGALVHVIRGDTTYVTSVQWSPDGKRFLTSSGDHTARLWDGTTFAPLVTMRAPAWLVYAVFSPDGRRVLAASFDGTARIFDAATGRLLRTVPAAQSSAFLWSARYSPDGRRIVTAGDPRGVLIYDATTLRLLRTLPLPNANWATFSPDGDRIATASDDGAVRMWDARTGRQIYAVRGDGAAFLSATFSADGMRFVTTSQDDTAQLRDARSGRILAVLSGSDGAVWSAAFSPDGRSVATGSTDGVGRVWDVRVPAPLDTHDTRGAIEEAAYSPDGRTIAAGGVDRVVRLWPASGRQAPLELHGHLDSINSVAFSSDGTRLVTASVDRTARVWDARTGKTQLVLRGHTDAVDAAVFTPDERRIVTGSDDHTARIWDAKTGSLLRVLPNVWQVLSVTVSPDGSRIAGGVNDGQVKIWDAATGRTAVVLRQHDSTLSSVAFSPDGKTIASASDDRLARVWDAGSGALLHVLRGHTAAVNAVRFSPDGSLIVTASDDGTARLWDARSGEPVGELDEPAGIESASFSPDGKRVLLAGKSGAVHVWDLPQAPQCQALIDAASRSLPRALTSEQREEFSIPAKRGAKILTAFMHGDACP